jgi:tetratricopeptide (TPR) repeat protein
MLAPIRDFLEPEEPLSSPLLCATRDHYFSRLSVDVGPSKPEFGEARWITSEDVNVEHLLDVSTAIDKKGGEIWDACFHFLQHLYWHKPRRTTLGLKIEGLPDDHRHKPKCLYKLSLLFEKSGNTTEAKRLITHTLELWRQQGDDFQVANTLQILSDTNQRLCLYEEGINQAKESLEIFERIGNTIGQAFSLNKLAFLLFYDKQLDAAENAASRAIDLLPEKGEEFTVCQIHQVLGQINQSKGEKKKAIDHFETAIRTASHFSWHDILFWTHYYLVQLFHDGEDDFNTARDHIERAKSHADGDPYLLGRVMLMRASIWYRQSRLEDAKLEASKALEILEELGATKDAEVCRSNLQCYERAMNNQGEFLETILHLTSVNFWHLIA